MTDLKIAFVGKGYSVATFIAYAPWDLYFSWAKKDGNTLTIDFYGKEDPWSDSVRGTGIVNHASYMWSRIREKLNDNSSIPSSRESLKNANQNLITGFKDFFHGKNNVVINDDKFSGLISTIDKVENENKWKINYDNNEPESYNLVIYGGGAGPHRDGQIRTIANIDTLNINDEYKRSDFGLWEKSMDLDAFMRSEKQTGNLQNKKVALQGENAGVDAAIAVIQRAGQLTWTMSEGKSPVWLSTDHYHLDGKGDSWVDKIQAYTNREKKSQSEFDWLKAQCEENILYLSRPNIVRCLTNNKFYNVKTKPDPQDDKKSLIKSKDEIAEYHGIDYHVYAVGQNANINNAPLKVLAPVLTDIRPIFDRNQHFGQVLETIIGFQYKNSSLVMKSDGTEPKGLFIIGATIPAIAGSISPSRSPLQKESWLRESGVERNISQNIDAPALVNNLTSQLNQQTVLAAAQLGAVRAQLQALLAPDIRSYWMAPVGLLEALHYLKDIGSRAQGKFTYKYSTVGQENQSPNSLLTSIKDGLENYHQLDTNHPLVVGGDIDKGAIEELIALLNPTANVDISKKYVITVPQKTLQKIQRYIEELNRFIDENINFNGLDKNALYSLLMLRFPHLCDEQLERFPRYIIAETAAHPWGIGFAITTAMMSEFRLINQKQIPD